MNLSPIVSDLQDIKQEVQGLDAPWCAEETQEAAVAYMDKYIEGYLAFMAEESDATVDEKFERADELLTDFKEARSALRANYLE